MTHLSLRAESSDDFADQLLPHLLALANPQAGVWGRPQHWFDRAVAVRAISPRTSGNTSSPA